MKAISNLDCGLQNVSVLAKTFPQGTSEIVGFLPPVKQQRTKRELRLEAKQNRRRYHVSIAMLLFACRGLPIAIGIERFPIECRKTNTKVITLANRNRCKQHNEPIRIRSKYIQPVSSARKRVRRGHDWFWFGFPLVEKVARVLLTNQSVVMQNQTKREITFDTQLKSALSEKETELLGRSRMFMIKGGMGLYAAYIINLFEWDLRDVE